MSFGPPVAYQAVQAGVRVYDTRNVEVGRLVQVLADENPDIFHGLIVKTSDGYRFADRQQVEQLYELGIRLAVPGDGRHDPANDPVAGRSAATDPVAEGRRRARQWLRDVT